MPVRTFGRDARPPEWQHESTFRQMACDRPRSRGGLLGVNAVVAYRNIRELHEHAHRLARTQSVLDALDNLLSTMKDAETGQRGFLITAEEEYLKPYGDALTTVYGQIAKVKRLTEDNPDQQARIPRVRELVRIKLDEPRRSFSTSVCRR